MANFQKPSDEVSNHENLEVDKIKLNRKWIIIPIISITVLSLLLLTVHLFFNTDPEDLVERWITAVDEGDSNQVHQLLGKNGEVFFSDEDVKRLISFYQDYPEHWQEQKKILQQSVEALKKDLNSSAYHEKFALVNLTYKGKKWLLINEYELQVNLASIKVQSNQDHVEWYLNDKKIEGQASSLLPGNHKIKAVYQNPYVEIEKEEELVLFNLDEGQTDVVIDFELAEIMISASEKDANIVINDTVTDILTTDEEVSIGLFPTDGTVTTYVQKEYPWGLVKSRDIPIKDDKPIHFEFSVIPTDMQDAILEKANALVEQQLLAITKQDASILEDATEEHRNYVEGIISEQLNKQVRKEYILLETNYDLTAFNEPFYNNGEDRYEISINSTVKTLETDYFQDLRVYDQLSKLFHYRFELYYDDEVSDWKFTKAVTQRYQAYDHMKSKTYTIRTEEDIKD